MGSRHFRAGVVIIVRRPSDDAVLAFERVDLPGQWQLPQGGIRKHEEPVAAAWRELAEETGLGPAEVELVDEHPQWVAYAWPPDVVGAGDRMGQVQRWFRFDIVDPATEPRPDGREFAAWRWCDVAWLVDQVVPFRRSAYAAVLK